MPNIRSSADLRNNYNDISSYCHAHNEPVFITKNGKGDLAVMSIEAYEELTSRFELYSQIKEGMDDIATGNTRPFPKLWLISEAAAVDELSGSYHFHRRTRYYACCGLHRIYPQKS